ncbi:hypothetical protein F5Y16DRAFT_407248 [Xylariaceae sp. FL0255]|nr:hypothetical protein F5Y16DRAFT_407248 [Xylariaceae sp. FL0255]
MSQSFHLRTDQSHLNTTSLYQCADCKRRYSRPEHLARHIQTRTLGKRFSCQVCGKAFARADLLKRHTANHENDGDSSKKRRRVDASPDAGRVSHACRGCALARVKCEEIKPCKRCQKRGLTCEFASAEASSAAAVHLLHLSASAHNDGVLVCSYSSSFGRPSTSYVMDNTPLGGFLRDVIYAQPFHQPRLAEAQGISFLSFCDNVNYDLTDTDFGNLDHWNSDLMGERTVVAQAATPQTDDSSVNMVQMRQKLVKIWTESPWRWVPDKKDHGFSEYGNLPLPYRDSTSQEFQERQRRRDRVVQDKVDMSSRDRILALVLSTCKTDAVRVRVATSFPSAEIIDTLTHVFLAAHLCSVSVWIHFATLKLNSQWAEWLAVICAAGAIMTPVPTLRKFGFAVQEAVRHSMPIRFEENNAGITDLGLVQALVLLQDLGLWSGNRRKMEIAECHRFIPITMLRYRGRYQRSSYARVAVEESDQGELLEEAWKRLAFHCYITDAQVSMTTLTNPTMSYAEMTLPLPEARELWFAKTALEWKSEYLSRCADQTARPPCIGDLLLDATLLAVHYRRLDTQFAISIYLHAFWSLIFDWRQLSAIYRSSRSSTESDTGPNLILSSRHQELRKSLSSFQLVTADWHAHFSAQEALLLNLLLMNVHVSFDDLQLFAGKEGEEQARRVYPLLQHWTDSADARQAIWHAGQMIRQAKMFPRGHMKEFYAVAVHHAAVTLWAYGVVTMAMSNQSISSKAQETVYLDGLETTEVQRFIGFGQGRPMIRGVSYDSGEEVESLLDDPRGSMEIAQDVLRGNFDKDRDLLPPIVENLCHLIKQLGSAADFMSSSTAAIVATTVVVTLTVLFSARAALWPRTTHIIRGALTTTIPNLTEVQHFPGARNVPTPYGNIRVYEFGPEDGKKVLLTHGISTSCMTLRDIATPLAEKGCRVMLFDLFGRGYSDAPGDLPYDTRLFVTQILLVLASSPLPWTGRNGLNVIGYSLGGAIAANFAATFPDMVESLVLLAPAGLIRPANIGRLSRLIFTSGLVPERLLAWLTKSRLRTPIDNAIQKRPKKVLSPIEDKEDLVDVAVQETIDPPMQSPTPFELAVTKYVHWSIDHNEGFVPSMMSTIRHAPLMEQHGYWKQLNPNNTAILIGQDDTLVQRDDYEEDALPLLGGKDGGVFWRIVPGAHNFPFTHSTHALKVIYEFWGMQ